MPCPREVGQYGLFEVVVKLTNQANGPQIVNFVLYTSGESDNQLTWFTGGPLSTRRIFGITSIPSQDRSRNRSR